MRLENQSLINCGDPYIHIFPEGKTKERPLLVKRENGDILGEFSSDEIFECRTIRDASFSLLKV